MGNGQTRPDFCVADDVLSRGFASMRGDDFCYSHTRSVWRFFDGQHWIDDALLELHTSLRDYLTREILPKLRKHKDRKEIGAHKTITNVEHELRAMLKIKEDFFDADPWVLNCPGGTIDLKLGDPAYVPFELREHDRTEYLTKMCAVDPSPAGEYPQEWIEFLYFVSNGDQDLMDYLQRLAGYCLVGVASEQMLAFLYGGGGNGKSVFVGLLERVLGDYCVVVPSEVFTAQMFDQHPEALMRTRGARLIISSEIATHSKWHEARIKAITGGDTIVARNMRENSVEFRSNGTLIIISNNQPALRGIDDAIKRRFQIVPFKVKITKEDKQFADKLFDAEGPGILRWMLDGCRMWQLEGLQPPEVVKTASKEYFEDEDHVAQWLGACCDDHRPVDAEHNRLTTHNRAKDLNPRKEPIGRLYASWKVWAERNGLSPGYINTLSSRLRAMGFERYRDDQERGFHDIEVRQTSTTNSND